MPLCLNQLIKFFIKSEIIISKKLDIYNIYFDILLAVLIRLKWSLAYVSQTTLINKYKTLQQLLIWYIILILAWFDNQITIDSA